MRYSQDLQNRVIADSVTLSVELLSEKYHLPVNIIRKWLLIDLTEEQLKVRVRQKFYNLFPLEEAKIISIFSKYISEEISDEEWELLAKKTNKELFNFALSLYKSLRIDFENHNKVNEA